MPLFTCSLLWVQHRSSGDKVLNCWFRVSANECAWVELVLGAGFLLFHSALHCFSAITGGYFIGQQGKKSHYQKTLFLNKNDKITFLIHPLEIHPAVSLVQPFLFGSFLPMKKKNLVAVSDTTPNFFSNSMQEQIPDSSSYSTMFCTPEENPAWTLTQLS